MKKIIIFLLSLLYSALSTAEYLSNILPNPIVQIDQSNFDFGRIQDGAQIEHTYIIRNAGTSDLEILDASADCVCIKMEITKSNIPPGQSGTLKINFNSENLGNFRGNYVSYPIDVRTNAKPVQFTLYLNGYVNKLRPKKPKKRYAEISFKERTHHFGIIEDGELVRHEYSFKNTGEVPLLITNAKGSCGCTVPEWSKEPIAPGDEGVIKVVYNSKGKGKEGGKREQKVITVTSNSNPNETRLFIKGLVYVDTVDDEMKAFVEEEVKRDKDLIDSSKEPIKSTHIEFENIVFDFGEITDGDKVEYKFVFKNTGDAPLIISNAKGSCGCTVPLWPVHPIEPGEKGEIKVVYNSKGKGKVGGKDESKTVTITANTLPPDTRVFVKGVVHKEE